MEWNMHRLILTATRVAFVGAWAVTLAACTKEKPPEDPAAASPTPTETASAAPSAASDPARDFPKVDPATLTDASSVADVHNALIRPSYQMMTDAEGAPPTDEAGWKALAEAPVGLSKGLALLTTGSRAKDQGDWVKFANAAAEKVKASADNIAKRNAEDLVFSDGDIQTACESCHGKYRK